MSRRCTQRLFLLRPDALVVQLYLYCLAEAALRFGVTLHGWIAMCNHHHVVIRDNRGNYPQFLEHLHKMLAKAMNAHLGRRENFWASEQPNMVWTVQPCDSLAKLIYVLANPVNADLVDRVSDWPGAHCLGHVLGGRITHVKRPRGYFRACGPMPDEVELRAERLDGFDHLTDAEWQALITKELERAERAAREDRRERKRGVLGRKAVLGTSVHERPKTELERSELRPSIACRSEERRDAELGLIKRFRSLYRAALAAWRGGDHAAVFPRGTYRMCWFGAVTGPPTAAAA